MYVKIKRQFIVYDIHSIRHDLNGRVFKLLYIKDGYYHFNFILDYLDYTVEAAFAELYDNLSEALKDTMF